MGQNDPQDGWSPSGNLLHSYWKWSFIVDFHIENGDFPVRYVSLPEDSHVEANRRGDTTQKSSDVSSVTRKIWCRIHVDECVIQLWETTVNACKR